MNPVANKTVAVVDYGMGNLRSVSQAVQAAAQGSGMGQFMAVVMQRKLGPSLGRAQLTP